MIHLAQSDQTHPPSSAALNRMAQQLSRMLVGIDLQLIKVYGDDECEWIVEQIQQFV
jgi:hypothetical protein